MRLPKRGEKGFTLIELLIVVAILGVLAAVIIPNVGRFLGRGEAEARRTEYHNVSAAVLAMMVDNGITAIPVPITAAANASNDMDGFPDITSTAASKGADAQFMTDAGATEVLGYLLYHHQLITDVNGNGTYEAGDGDAVSQVNYVTMTQTVYFYTAETDGTIHQYDIPGGTEFVY